MDHMKLVLLCTLMHQFMITLTHFQQRWDQERIDRHREQVFFLQQLMAQGTAFMRRRLQQKKKRTCWAKVRSRDWWYHAVKNFTEEEWLENFRMSKSTFKFICQRLKPYLKPSDNCVRKPLGVKLKVAIALSKLASCGDYTIIANKFGTSKSAVHKCLYEVCDALSAEFKKEYLSLPNESEAEEVAASFEEMCGIPNIYGAIGGHHLHIVPPAGGYEDYINEKDWPSYNMMAVVDHLYRFRYATCQHPGSVDDATVLKDSSLYQNADNLIPESKKTIDDTNIPYIVVGGLSYPLLPWLLKGYTGMMSQEEESFNVYLSHAIAVAENAFAMLKARFRCLLKRNDMKYTYIPNIVMACIILHNIVETRKERFVPEWMSAVHEAESRFAQPDIIDSDDLDNYDMSVIRDTLKTYMATKYPLLEQS